MTSLRSRRVYSTEELHRLRNTQSLPKLHEAIEQNDGEDADVVKASRSMSAHPSLLGTTSPSSTNEPVHLPDSPASDGGVRLLMSEYTPEHVLRGAKSFAARSLRSRTSGTAVVASLKHSSDENQSTISHEASLVGSHTARSSTLPVLGEISHNIQPARANVINLRPSPTPSVKRKKVEAILQAHGSPTHVRVTAGGRIVPSEQSPLCHPRYGYSAVKANGGLIRFAPNYNSGKSQWTVATENGFVAQDMEGNLCQIVNGTVQPLYEINGALQLHMPAPNLHIDSRGSSLAQNGHVAMAMGSDLRNPLNPAATVTSTHTATTSQATATNLAEPSLAAQISALENEYSKLERDLKEVDKTEVIHGRTMTKVAKDALIGKRRDLVINMDKIRRTIKAAKDRSLPKPPLSPRNAARGPRPLSPRNRLPAFLRNPQAGMYSLPQGSFFNAAHAPQLPSSADIGVNPVSDFFNAQPWMGPPAAMYSGVPGFDGSLPQAFDGYTQAQSFHEQAMDTVAVQPGVMSRAPEPQPQPGERSHAVTIKTADPKPATGVKSILNPMSPAYRPVGVAQQEPPDAKSTAELIKDRAPTPFALSQPLKMTTPEWQQDKGVQDDEKSAVNKTPCLRSSSISSFETADFFPRNPDEYSVRHQAYPNRVEASEDKENVSPATHAVKHDVSVVGSGLSRSVVHPRTSDPHSQGLRAERTAEAPVAPPGTPTNGFDTSMLRKGSHSSWTYNLDAAFVPDRAANNTSPKTKRRYQDPSAGVGFANNATRAAIANATVDEQGSLATLSPQDTIDFSDRPRDWIEGYQAGLHRHPVGADRMGDFLDGYCSGLLKSKSAAPSAVPSPTNPTTGGQTKNESRKTSPAIPLKSAHAHRLHEPHSATRPTLETAGHSMDTMKEAVYAPHNENAVLTPLPDGLHVSDVMPYPRPWAKLHEHASPGQQTAGNQGKPDAKRDLHSGTIGNGRSQLAHPLPLLPNSAKKLEHEDSFQDAASLPAARVTSITSIDSQIQRQWPGHRVISPFDWKATGSVAQVANLAVGYFGHAQFDGTSQRSGSVMSGGKNPEANMLHHSRFYEGSLDGIDSPPGSPLLPTASDFPPLSPSRSTPRKESGRKVTTTGTPKGPSPAKAKFEHIAERVGIRGSGARGGMDNASINAEGDLNSPPGKRRWRDVWRKPMTGKEESHP